MSNPFPPAGTRPWTRISNAAKSISAIVLGKGELAVTETGKVVAGNGATQLKNLSPFLTAAEATAQFVTWNGTNLTINGTVIPISGGGTPNPVVATDNGDGNYTLTGTGVTNNGDGYLTLTGTNVTSTGDAYVAIAA